MKSGTSFFNPTLFKKNLTRYWPIWALYTLIWTYALPVTCLMVQQQTWRGANAIQRVTSFAKDIPDMLEVFGPFMAFTFGILAAMGVFSYLYNNRSAGMMHSLPVRREGLFLTSYLSGLVCLLGPNLLVWLLTLGAESLCGYINLYTISIWLAAQSAMCLFFYSFAVFCAMFTGHLLALPAFYGIFNFLAAVLMLLFDVMFEPFLYGYAGMTSTAEEVVRWLTPMVRLSQEVSWSNPGLGYRLEGIPELVIYAVVGLVFAALALLVYRKRHIETAGDVVAVAVVRPIFKYGVALCSGLCFGYWLYAIFGYDALFGLTGSLLLWTFIGYFVAEMLLKKSFRVWKAWRGCAVLLVLVAVGLTCLRTDAFGFVTRVPTPAAVESIVVDGMGSYPYDEGRNFAFETDDPALIEKTVALHQAIVNEYQEPKIAPGSQMEYIRLRVDYHLSNGTIMRRSYGTHVCSGSELEQAARDFYCSPEITKQAYGLNSIDPTQLVNVEISSLWNPNAKKNEYYDLSQNIPVEQRQTALLAIYNAVMADFEQGNLGKRYLFDLEDARQLNTCTTDLTIYWNRQPEQPVPVPSSSSALSIQTEMARSYVYSSALSITMTPNAENTIRVLTQLGVLDEDTTLRLYADIVDEEERAKNIYGYMGHDPEELTSINLNPNSADIAIIGGADGPTSITVSTPWDVSTSEVVSAPASDSTTEVN